MEKKIVYLDNAATSHFKPKEVFSALSYDLTHSANSGRSGHSLALDSSMRIENARQYLLNILGCDDTYELIFTKNCTEALNLAIFGYIRQGMKVVADVNAHNSVLRPLYELQRRGIATIEIADNSIDGTISIDDMERKSCGADLIVATAVSNVTGAVADIRHISDIAKTRGAKLLIDGAQAVPIIELSINNTADMLAVPGHKALHGVQGTGFLVFKKDLELIPLLYGGTGTASSSVFQTFDLPEGFEAGTQFAGGISALHAGAKWTYENLTHYRLTIKKLAAELIKRLNAIGASVYTENPTAGVISFNLNGVESSLVADKLDEKGIAVRSGLHCAPLVHRFLHTEQSGAVRASLGIDSYESDIYAFMSALEDINRMKPIF